MANTSTTPSHTRNTLAGRHSLQKVSLIRGAINMALLLLLMAMPMACGAVPCNQLPQSGKRWAIKTTKDAKALAEFAKCTGGAIMATWAGEIIVTSTIVIGSGTALSVRGVTVPDGEVAAAAAIGTQFKELQADETDGVRLFSVSPSGTLSLSNMRLSGGRVGITKDYNYSNKMAERTQGHGAAVSAHKQSNIALVNVQFTDNYAQKGGAVYASGAKVAITGCIFKGNQALHDFYQLAVTPSSARGVHVPGQGGAVFLSSGSAATISNTRFEGNLALDDMTGGDAYGGALALDEASTVVIGDKTIFMSNAATYGGAIYISNGSSAQIRDTTFLKNMARTSEYYDGQGGAISVDSDSDALITQCIFQSNIGHSGGALYIAAGGQADILDGNMFVKNGAQVGAAISVASGGNADIKKSRFRLNQAVLSGGAIYCNGEEGAASVVTMDTWLSDNKAQFGGAISVLQGCQAKFTDCQVSNNAAQNFGGGLFVSHGSTVTVSGGQLNFNTAHIDVGPGDSRGGALFVGNSSTASFDQHARLKGNGADNGGAMYIQGSKANMQATSLHGNHAKLGGALHVAQGTVFIGQGCQVQANRAEEGAGVFLEGSSTANIAGMIFSQNRAAKSGAAVRATDNSTVNIVEGHFYGNSAGENGGAIDMDGVTVVDVGSNYSANSAVLGGAVHAAGGSLTCTSSTFEGNTATQGGGALYLDGDSAYWQLATDLCTFISNGAPTGGAAYMQDGRASMTATTFSGNRADSDAGAVLVGRDASTALTSCHFDLNLALNGGGGAVLADQPESLAVTSCTFTENSASQGGALHLIGEGLGTLTLTSTTLSNNTAVREGGAIYVATTIPGRAEDCVFEGNSSPFGGAIFNLDTKQDWQATFSARACSFAENSATVGAGGAFLQQDGVLPTWMDPQKDLATSDMVFNGNTAKCCFAGGFTPGLGDSCMDVASGYSTNRDCCTPNQYMKTTDQTTTCEFCDEQKMDCGGGIFTVATLPLKEGYWRASTSGTDIRKCPNMDACTGAANSYCATGHTGPYCAVCDAGYAGVGGGDCVECDSSGTGFAFFPVLGLLLFLMLFIAWFLTSTLMELGLDEAMGAVSDVFQHIRVPVVVLQVLTQFVAITGVSLPETYATFLSWAGFINIDLSQALAVGCYINGNFYMRLLLVTLLPLAFVLILFGLRYVLAWFGCTMSATSASDSPAHSTARSGCTSKAAEATGAPTVIIDSSFQKLTPQASSSRSSSRAHATRAPSSSPLAPATLGTASSNVSGSGSSSAKATERPPRLSASGCCATSSWDCSRRLTQPLRQWLQRIVDERVKVLLALSFFVFSGTSAVVFQTFACEDVGNGRSYLRADYSIECGLPQHRAFSAYALVMVVVYPIGIPALYAWVLWTAHRPVGVQSWYACALKVVRDRLGRPGPAAWIPEANPSAAQPTPFAAAAALLSEPYTERAYYWEVCECARRLALTGMLVFILQDTAGQEAVACVIAFVTLLIYGVVRPHAPSDQGRLYGQACLYTLGATIIFLSMFVALLEAGDYSNEDASSRDAIGVLLVLLNIGLITVSLVQVVLVFYHLKSKCRKCCIKHFLCCSGHQPEASGAAAAEPSCFCCCRRP